MIMYEYDEEYLERIREYSKRRWEEPLIQSYIWDRYDLDTTIENRQRLICRTNVDYAYSADYNLRIITSANTTSPFQGQTLWISSVCYNSDGELEEGHLVLYKCCDDSSVYQRLGEVPYSEEVGTEPAYKLITKYYPPDITEYAEEIDSTTEENISSVLEITPRTYLNSDYYVSMGGNDKNPGTIEQPFRTLAKAADTVEAGGTICILVYPFEKETVCFSTNCNLITDEPNKLIIVTEEAPFAILPNTQIYLQGISLKSVYDKEKNFMKGHTISNQGTGLISIDFGKQAKTITYDINLKTPTYWISGETIEVNLELTGDYNRKTFKIYNSLNELLTTETSPAKFDYKGPDGLEEESVRVFVPEDNYLWTESFEIYNVDSDFYVDTVDGSDTNTGTSLQYPFKTLEKALSMVTTNKYRIFFQGEQDVRRVLIKDKVLIRGLLNKSTLSTDEIFFRVQGTLTLSDLFLNDVPIDSLTVENDGTATTELLKFSEVEAGVLYVDGANGNDSNTGKGWSRALSTLAKALSLEPTKIYYSDLNTITSPLTPTKECTIIGTMNTNKIVCGDESFFQINNGVTLNLQNITLTNYSNTEAKISNNTYVNEGGAKCEVIL